MECVNGRWQRLSNEEEEKESAAKKILETYFECYWHADGQECLTEGLFIRLAISGGGCRRVI